MERISPQVRLFIEAYDGDTISSMRAAGFQGPDSNLKARGEKLLLEPLVQEAIKLRTQSSTRMKRIIATREERQELWSQIMKNEDPYQKEERDENGVPLKQAANLPLPIRLKASELLGKSEADFVDKIQATVEHSVSDLISQSYDITTPIDVIEAEYRLSKDKPVIDFTAEEKGEPESLEDLI